MATPVIKRRAHGASITQQTVTTVEEFISAVASFTNPHGSIWYRGHSKESHRLIPSIYRMTIIKPEDELRRLEEKMNRRFRDRSMPHSFQGRDESSDVSELQSWWRLFTMQHYGTPTRLLDWSENALTALCFAVFGAAENATEDAVVWMLDPCNWNNIGNSNHAHPLSVDEHGAGPYAPLPSSNQHVQAAWPLAVYGMHNSPRIITQQGTFVVFPPGKATSMEEHAITNGDRGISALKAIKLHRDSIKDIASVLRKLGFAQSSLYPDLHGLSADLKKDFGY
ncbi:hypothetical protein DBR42_03795 [Pelomonas sp. HMWF004]|nr:hypothetical protein DBR42_03795 [Pelomonas sp. HMWF004]